MGEKLLIKGAELIDCVAGNAPFHKTGNLLIEGDSILEVGNVTAEDARVIDASGKFIMPGLISCHVHCTLEGSSPDPMSILTKDSNAVTALRGARNLTKLLRSGVTFFRDMGAGGGIDIDLRNARSKGLIQGAEFHAAGRSITMTGGHGWMFGRQVDGCDEARKAVREQLKAGADVIKIIATGGVMTAGVEPGAPQLSYEEIAVIVEEANKAGRKTASHAQGSTGILNSVRAGISSIEHGIYLTDEIIELMLKQGTYLVPTLLAPTAIFKGGVAAGIPAFAVEKTGRILDTHIASFQKAYRAGVKIAMGPDTGTPLNSACDTAVEVKLMVDNGMSTIDAIQSSTVNAADLLGISSRYGSLEKGKAADFLILGANPLENIEALRNNLQCVYKLGKLVE